MRGKRKREGRVEKIEERKKGVEVKEWRMEGEKGEERKVMERWRKEMGGKTRDREELREEKMRKNREMERQYNKKGRKVRKREELREEERGTE